MLGIPLPGMIAGKHAGDNRALLPVSRFPRPASAQRVRSIVFSSSGE